MNKYLATVRVEGQGVRTLVFAESPTHARLLLQYQFGLNSIISHPTQTSSIPEDCTLLDNLIKPKSPLSPEQMRIQGLKQGVERSRQQLKAEQERQRQRREAEQRLKDVQRLSSLS